MPIKKIVRWLVIFLSIEAVLFGLLFWGKQRAEQQYIASVLEHHRGEYAAALDSFNRLARFVAEQTFLRSEVVDMFAEAAKATGPERDRLRTQLYAHLLPSYNSITSQGVRQVQFHFADGTSFLRMHLPGYFGDQLFAARPSVRKANTEKRFVQGFEMGRDNQAFRYIFPLAKDGEHLGTVEFGVPFQEVSKALNKVYQEDYFLILKKEVVEKVLRADLEKKYMGSRLAQGYLQEKIDVAKGGGQNTENLGWAVMGQVNAEIRAQVAAHLADGRSFALAARVGGLDYLVTFLPVTNTEGSIDGYLVAYGLEPTLASLRHGYLAGLFLATLLLVLLFSLHFWTNQKIDRQLSFQRQLMEAIPFPVTLKDRDGVLLSCNQAVVDLLRLPREKIIGQRTETVFAAPEVGAQQQALDRKVMVCGHNQQEEQHLSYPDGTSRDLLVVKAPFVDEKDRVAGVIGVAVDITEQKRSAAKIAEAYVELDEIFNTAANGMRVVDRDHTVIRANRTFYALTGTTPQEVVGKKCYETFAGSACHTDLCPLNLILANPQRLEAEIVKVMPSGRRLNCLVSSTPHYNANGEVIGIIEDFKDVTHYKELEQHLREIAITDELTGLFNRRGFLTLAEKQLGNALRAEHDMFLIFADLDKLKEINDTMGHETGDLAIASAASLLRNTFRQADIIARLGGDEFAVFISCNPGTDSEQAIIARLEANIVQENRTGELPFALGLSFGVVQLHEGETLGQVMIRADALMYASKSRKKGGARNGGQANPVA